MDTPERDHLAEPLNSSQAKDINWEPCETVYSPRRLPLNDVLELLTSHRQSPSHGPHVCIDQTAMDVMLKHAGSDTSAEVGGVLLGKSFADESKPDELLVIVTTAIAARNTLGTPTHLQFTAESWDSVFEDLPADCDDVIIGWYHTHPGLSVFMSGIDRKTQAAFFSRPWQIAIVIDPIANDIGYFHGEDSTKIDVVHRINASSLSENRQEVDRKSSSPIKSLDALPTRGDVRFLVQRLNVLSALAVVALGILVLTQLVVLARI